MSIPPWTISSVAASVAMTLAAEAAKLSTRAVIGAGCARMAATIACAPKTEPPGLLIRSVTGPVVCESALMNWSGEMPPNHAASSLSPAMTSYIQMVDASARMPSPLPLLASCILINGFILRPLLQCHHHPVPLVPGQVSARFQRAAEAFRLSCAATEAASGLLPPT